MAALDRVFNIAQTGRIDEPTPVDNIMAQYKPREQAQGGLWNGVKNFAGSNGGRMLLGGLAGTALGGLMGRNINEALTGGIMGATGAANGITRRNQYNDMIARQQQERADKIKQLADEREFRRDMQDRSLAQQKELADLAFNRRMQELAADKDFRREMANEARANAIADRQSDYDFRTKLANEQFERQKELLGLNQDFTREGWQNQSDLENTRYQRGLDAEIAREERENERYNQRLADNRAYNAGLLADQRAYDNQIWQRNQDADIARENRANELYNTRIADQRDYDAKVLADNRTYNKQLADTAREYEAQKLAEQRKYDEGLIAAQRAYDTEQAKNKFANDAALAGIKAQYDQQKDLNKLEYKRKEAEQKAELESKEAERQNEIMRPRLEQSLLRARTALKDGTGLGQFGGWGWTTGQGGQNRADVMTAQAQINTMMRGLLKQMGVGSTELNSAAEAAAYRYQISPDMPIEQISRVLDDFGRDYMNGTLQKEAAAVAGQYGANSGSGNFTIERID